jgi:hypothetical protein
LNNATFTDKKPFNILGKVVEGLGTL